MQQHSQNMAQTDALQPLDTTMVEKKVAEHDKLTADEEQKLEIKKLKSELYQYRVQNIDLKNTNRDLNAKLSRLQNTINNLQRTVREQAVKVLDEMFDGMKK